MRIDQDSLGSLFIVFLIGAIIIVVTLLLNPKAYIKWPIIGLTLLFCIWQAFFFRVPDRKPVGSNKIVSSAADGRVVICDVAYEDEILQRECKRVCVYMDFFDVHANFWPLTGKVTYFKYHPGKNFLAFKPKASEYNEHFTTVISNDDSQEVLMRQIAGTFARRIVCYSSDSLPTKAGEQCGIIKFGSRMDLYLPMDAEIKVKVGDNVRACESVIAILSGGE